VDLGSGKYGEVGNMRTWDGGWKSTLLGAVARLTKDRIWVFSAEFGRHGHDGIPCMAERLA